MELEAVLLLELVEFSVVWWAIKCVELVLAVREPEGHSVPVEILKVVLKAVKQKIYYQLVKMTEFWTDASAFIKSSFIAFYHVVIFQK